MFKDDDSKKKKKNKKEKDDSDAEFEYDVYQFNKNKKNSKTGTATERRPSLNHRSYNNDDTNSLRAYIRPIKLAPADEQGPHRVIRVPPENIDPSKDEKSSLWDVIGEREAVDKLSELAIEYRLEHIQTDVVDIAMEKIARRVLIQSRREQHLVLLPQLLMKEKISRRAQLPPQPVSESGDKTTTQKKPIDSIFLHDFQEWKFNKIGFIYSSFFPKICLTLHTTVPVQLEIHLRPRRRRGAGAPESDESRRVVVVKKGYMVGLGTRQLTENNDYRDQDQHWCFNKHANIYSKVSEWIIIINWIIL